MTTLKLKFDDNEVVRLLYGDLNRNLSTIESTLKIKIKVRGSELAITGSTHDLDLVESTLTQLYDMIVQGAPIYQRDVAYALRILSKDPTTNLMDIFQDQVFISAHQKVISPKSVNQKNYIEAIRHNDIVFGIGPAGTGKTYLAVAMAVAALTSKQVKTIILARPAVEAGERLGFLPGDMAEKVNPYLRPLYDALYDMLGIDKALELIEREIIEIAPLAFMRGRTLDNAFVILDEAQNTTKEQMQMFLTRLGFNSKAVITGDITQIDLPRDKGSGLIHSSKILGKINGINFTKFSEVDVVRHPLVQKIILAYAKKYNSTDMEPKKET